MPPYSRDNSWQDKHIGFLHVEYFGSDIPNPSKDSYRPQWHRVIPINQCIGFMSDKSYAYTALKLDHSEGEARVNVIEFDSPDCDDATVSSSHSGFKLVSGGNARLLFKRGTDVPMIAYAYDNSRNQSPRLINESVVFSIIIDALNNQ